MSDRKLPDDLVTNDWYVMDEYGRTAADAYVSGPHPTRRAAREDRAERNIAEDCSVLRLPRHPRPNPQQLTRFDQDGAREPESVEQWRERTSDEMNAELGGQWRGHIDDLS